MKNNYLVINESVDPYYNLALEEYLLTHYMEGKVVMLWQNDNTIVVGRHQNAIEEINQQYVKEHSIKVVRRTTGGGAVYHDLGNLNYSFITDRDQSDDHGLKCMISPVIEWLRSLGVMLVSEDEMIFLQMAEKSQVLHKEFIRIGFFITGASYMIQIWRYFQKV